MFVSGNPDIIACFISVASLRINLNQIGVYMAITYTHPHFKINVIDQSIYSPEVREQLSLFTPIFFMRAQKGPLNVPYYCSNYTVANEVFGEGTFDLTTKYFSREAFFLKGLFPNVGCFITRLADDTAKAGTVVLELKVQKTNLKQWERDSEGNYRYDPETDERIPLIDEATSTQVEEPGVELTWNVRQLKTDGKNPETLNNLKPTTHGTGASEYVVYPIIAAKCKYVGEYTNNTGFKFFFDYDNLDSTLARQVKSIPYSFGIVSKSYNTDTVSPVHSIFQSKFESFVARPNQIDTRTHRQVSFTQVLKNNYKSEDIPWEIKLYNDNIATIGSLIQSLEPDDDTLTDPYLVNITNEYNLQGKPMPHVKLTDESIFLNDSYVIYLDGGSDGDISDACIEDLTRQYLLNKVYPDIQDSARYPFTAIVDTGVSIPTKQAFLSFMSKNRDDFKVILSTQDSNLGRYNTKAEDYSTGMSLYADALLQPESQEKGTGCCRVSIFQHAGKVADTTYDEIIPFTYDIALKKAKYLASNVIAGQPAGLPHSAIEVFREWNWTANDADLKQMMWDCGLNYCQYYDMTSIHWTAMRSVYQYDTSVLSSDFFTDIIVFIKHIVRYQWSKYVGVEMTAARYMSIVTKSVQDNITAMLNGYLTADVEMSQTAEQAKIGYISTLTITLNGNAQQRIWSVDVICKRNDYNSSIEE